MTEKQIRELKRFMPSGVMLALHPQAYGAEFGPMAAANTTADESTRVAVIEICGPLNPKKNHYFDSYEGIKERFAAAIALGVRGIVMSIDSPGGYVSGCFDTARELRKMCDAADVQLFAHVEGTCASAAYALATAARVINVSQTANVGSVGVIDTLIDITAQNAMMGVKIKLIASGERKADYNPNQPLTPEAEASTKAKVDKLADHFFALCESHGWSNAAALKSLEGSVMTGDQAVDYKLATAIASLDETITQAGSPRAADDNDSNSGKGSANMAKALEEAKKALQAAIDGDDKKASARAKKALAAMEEEAEGDEDAAGAESEDDDEAGGASDDDASAEDGEGDEDEEKEEKKEEAAAAARAALGRPETPEEIAIRALSEVHSLKASVSRDKKRSKIDRLLATRADIGSDLCALLRKQPFDVAKAMIEKLPRGKPARKLGDRVTANVGATQGSQNANAPRLDVAAKSQLDAAMGLTGEKFGVVNEPNRMVFGAKI